MENESVKKRIIAVMEGPSITTSNAVGRVVELEDGGMDVEIYGPRRGWTSGGTNLGAMMISLPADEENLREMGYSDKEIAEILAPIPGPENRDP